MGKLTREVRLRGLGRAVSHVGGAVQKAAHIQSLLRVLDLFGKAGEVAGADSLFADGCLVFLDAAVDLSVELSRLTHVLKHLVLVGLQRILQGDLTLSLTTVSLFAV